MSQVKFFRSTDFGAPQLYGNAGYMIQVLDACLVNGYGQQNIAAMTHSGGTVTVTTASSHGLSTYSRQTIAGANEAGYNGEFVITIINGTTFTYQASGITVDTATGTMTTKTEAAGWTKPFSGTNLAVYRGGSGLRHFYRFNDTVTIASRMLGYVDMTDVNTGTEAFPTNAQMSGGLYWQKSTTADATNAKPWVIWADDKTMYMFVWYGVQTLTYSDMCMMGLGEFISYRGGDQYASFVSAAHFSNSYNQMPFGFINSNVSLVLASSGAANGMYAPRSYSQVGTAVVLGKVADYSKSAQTGIGYLGSLPYPHPVDGGLYMCPITIVEGGAVASASVIRGVMRGVMNPLHNHPLAHYDIFEGNGDSLGKRFQAISFSPSHAALGQIFVDISTSWE